MNKGLIVAGSLLAVVGLYAIMRNNETNARAVTKTGFAGGTNAAVVTTPIRAPAFIAPESSLDLLLKAGGRLFSRVAGIVLPAKTDAMQRQGNTASASAAYTSPLRADYKPTVYADF